MSGAEGAAPLDDFERDRLLAPFLHHRRILIAISGGPDSTALAWLATRWRAALADGPALVAATVDHGLRADSRAEAEGVARWCAGLGLSHRILSWLGEKPARGIQEAARAARYRLLAEAARAAGADAIALAHTADDQAETVLFRLARGSGLSGLAAMRPATSRHELTLLRPLLEVPKARLVATLQAAGIGFVRDPANADPRFARARFRALAPVLAAEGLDARRLGLYSRRMARADAALEAATDDAERRLALAPSSRGSEEVGAERYDLAGFAALPEEIALRLLGRAMARLGHEGPVELGKLEALAAALGEVLAAPVPAGERRRSFRRTLAGAVVSVRRAALEIRPAPLRRSVMLAPNSPEM